MPTIKTQTEALLELRRSEVPRGVSYAHPIFAAKARGAKIWDVEGNEYLDWVGGIGVLNTGHNHPRVVRAVQEQLERFIHACFQVTMYEPYLRLAERLNRLAPGDTPRKTIFLTTGAEAVENAVKIARAYTKRPAVISFAHSFHGRTLLGMSLTGKASYYKQNFGPFAPEIYQAPFPYPYRGWDSAKALEGLHELFHNQVDPGQVAALILEPVQGEGGFIPAPFDFVRELRRLADEHGILLIADEIQSGFGRTGKMFAMEHTGVAADMITVAKSLAGGLPLSGVIGRAEVMDAPDPGGLGGTYAGNPLACAAALAVLEVFEEEKLLEKSQRLGKQLEDGLSKIQSKFSPVVGEQRGLGAMRAIELVKDSATKEPAPELAQKVVEEARARGLLLLKAGMHTNCIRVLVPLVAGEKEVERGLGILTESLEAALR